MSGAAYTLLGAVLLLHAFVLLLSKWSISWRVAVQYRRVAGIDAAGALMFVRAAPHRGSSDVCPLQRSPDGSVWFEFQKRRFEYHADKKLFVKPRLPVDQSPAYYLAQRGVSEGTPEFEHARATFGRNKFEVPKPSVSQLFVEQLFAPFFVFQLVSVALWALDDMIYYSLFTLSMLLIFELTIATQRVNNLKAIRTFEGRVTQLNVFRSGVWRMLSSDELVPGDLVSVVRSDVALPCDTLQAIVRLRLTDAVQLLLSGRCIVNESMLTGESVPQAKESLATREDAKATLDIKSDRLHIVYSGTRVVLQSADAKSAPVRPPPDHGCVGFVLRTGFHSTQGRLVRTIVYSTENVTVNSWEAGLLLLFLLCFALAASGYVLQFGLAMGQPFYKLLLACALIITTVVPPELPMELSMAVTTSMQELARSKVFCTEPFRIPMAGRLSVCCFDKTGTLTDTKFRFDGVASLENFAKPHTGADVPRGAQVVLAGCQSLSVLDGDLIGDDMERCALMALGWNVRDDTASSKALHASVHVLRRWHFSSLTKRMTAIVCVISGSTRTYMSVVKGAPEAVRPLLGGVDELRYEVAHSKHTREGGRVLALASRVLPSVASDHEAARIDRAVAESNMQLEGLAVFSTALLADAKQCIEQLVAARMHCVIVSGDHPLTCCHVATQLGIMRNKDRALLDVRSDTVAEWSLIDATPRVAYPFAFTDRDYAAPRQLSANFDTCVTGDGVEFLKRHGLLDWYLPHIRVFARVNPQQKELILSSFKAHGNVTLMCGDGTNDVGALKQAHVGVSLLLAEDRKSVDEAERDASAAAAAAAAATSGSGAGAGASAGAGVSAPKKPAQPPVRETLKERMERMREEMRKLEEVRLKSGDASVAAPFTARNGRLDAVVDIVRQGRCTLVSTTQMFKIVALNSLITAYSLSVLTLDGIQLGDAQVTSIGMMTAICFLSISRSKPLPELAPRHPSKHFFTPYVVTTVLLQFAVHLTVLIVAHRWARILEPLEGVVDLDAKFTPSIANSVVFVVSAFMIVTTFIVNYKGAPFMYGLFQNRAVLYSLLATGAGSVLCLLSFVPELNQYLELVDLSFTTMRYQVLGLMLADLAGAWLLEVLCSKLLDRGLPAKVLGGPPVTAMPASVNQQELADQHQRLLKQREDALADRRAQELERQQLEGSDSDDVDRFSDDEDGGSGPAHRGAAAASVSSS